MVFWNIIHGTMDAKEVCCERKEEKQAKIHGENIENGDALAEIRHWYCKHHAAEHDRHRFAAPRFEKFPDKDNKYSKIAQKTNDSRLGEIIEENAMRTIKPCF